MTDNQTDISNFIRNIVDAELSSGKHAAGITTRFPPEPNGYLHIGHAKSICLNFGIAQAYKGCCNLRFDDTNPETEEIEYVDAIKEDVKWLGFDWHKLHFASDYFEQLYVYAEQLIQQGKAYVDSSPAEKIREARGSLTEPGCNSPYRERTIAENIDLFRRMRAGEFPDGAHVLRAKIDMAAGNINLRDPILYRIKHAQHHRSGNRWCIYPLYDYTHCLSDSIEEITHSLCTLEFEDHRPLYEWVLAQLETPGSPRQIEFAKLALEYTVLSKRKLRQLVELGLVENWDDPRMPTLSGMRRRGYTAKALRDFCERIGITKNDAWIDMGVLENSLREDLNEHAERRMAVIDPIKLTIENFPEDKIEYLTVPNHPQHPHRGSRQLTFSRELYIERDDFMEQPIKKFFRLAPGQEVRLRYAYCVTCTEVVKDAQGEIVELRCNYDPHSGQGKTADGRKVKGIIHWVDAKQAVTAEIRLYDRLFRTPQPGSQHDFKHDLNPDSLITKTHAKLEPSLCNTAAGTPFQFERLGYFVPDSKDYSPTSPVFNRSVSLRDSWAKLRNGSA